MHIPQVNKGEEKLLKVLTNGRRVDHGLTIPSFSGCMRYAPKLEYIANTLPPVELLLEIFKY